jgi:hypothetical protein
MRQNPRKNRDQKSTPEQIGPEADENATDRKSFNDQLNSFIEKAGVNPDVIAASSGSGGQKDWFGFFERHDSRDRQERKEARDSQERREYRRDMLTIVATLIGGVVLGAIVITCILASSPTERDRVIELVVSLAFGSGAGASGGYALGRNRQKADSTKE